MAYTAVTPPTTGTPISTADFGIPVANDLADHETRILAIEGATPSVPTLVTERQGGSATNWSTPGTTNYTPTAANIKKYKGTVNVTHNAEQLSSVVVTFPEAFTNTPHIMVNAGVFFMLATWWNPSNSQFTINVYCFTGNSTGTTAVTWEAEGE
ncbi:MAG: hypothetical protein PHE50_02650 [Dehalococcoidales bacterium]|jgi:hypothetical protein|nr:hypothetical protein [Dehalococcoidales bacterium]MDD5189925.1 hypothetical protein [Dehalococcoidales bacterium]